MRYTLTDNSFTAENVRFFRGDCLDLLPQCPDRSVNLILADLPYERTACSWDSAIPLEPLWREYRRVLAPGGCVLLFADMPFAARLLESNPKWFSHEVVWDKNKCGSPGLAKYRPMKVHEYVLVFAPGRHTYNPQMEEGEAYSRRPPKQVRCNNHGYGFKNTRGIVNHGTRYPKSVQRSSRDFSAQQQIHPTQKPVPFVRWLVRSYSNPGDVVLDNAAGVASSGVACIEEGRPWVGMERDIDPRTGASLGYFDAGCARLIAALGLQEAECHSISRPT
jgi:DNA modification methylase